MRVIVTHLEVAHRVPWELCPWARLNSLHDATSRFLRSVSSLENCSRLVHTPSLQQQRLGLSSRLQAPSPMQAQVQETVQCGPRGKLKCLLADWYIQETSQDQPYILLAIMEIYAADFFNCTLSVCVVVCSQLPPRVSF